MPTDVVWFLVTVPKKEYERQLVSWAHEIKPPPSLRTNDFFALQKEIFDQEKTIPLETILIDCLEQLNVQDAVWAESRNNNYFKVYFSVELVNNDYTMMFLKSRGIGSKHNSSVGYVPFSLFMYNENENSSKFNKNYFQEMKDNFLKSVASRLTVAQVVEGVKASAELTFNYWIYLFCSSTIACIAILTNQPVDIAASMMIEPLMACVIAISFGIILWSWDLMKVGFKGLFVGLAFCLIYGFFFGLIFETWRVAWNVGDWPTSEMQGRGIWKTLIYGTVIASSGGSILAVALLHNNVMAMTGVAVATTFMPPFVNSGLCFALAIHLHVDGNFQNYTSYEFNGNTVWLKPAWAPPEGYTCWYSYDMRIETSIYAVISIAYTFINVFFLGTFGLIVLKLKELIPLQFLTPIQRNFFNEDIRIYRAYQKKYSGPDLGREILSEWAIISGIDRNKSTGNTVHDRKIQMQTLYDIVNEVESNQNYQTITKHAYGNRFQPELKRRLTQPIINDGGIDTMMMGNDYEMNNNDKHKMHIFAVTKTLQQSNKKMNDNQTEPKSANFVNMAFDHGDDNGFSILENSSSSQNGINYSLSSVIRNRRTSLNDQNYDNDDQTKKTLVVTRL